MIRQAKNIAPHLIRLVVDEVAFVGGKHKAADGTIESNNKPDENAHFDDIKSNQINKNVFISNVGVENLGSENDGLNGDVFLSYFNKLPNLDKKYQNVFTSSDPRYFMILNGLTSGSGLPKELQTGSSYETRQKITVTFENIPSVAKLKKVIRATTSAQGSVVDVELVDGNKLVTTIGGGYSDLHYWELGTINPTTTSKTIKETGLDNAIQGNPKYVNEIKKMDFGGETFVVGNIKGTDDIAPEPSYGISQM